MHDQAGGKTGFRGILLILCSRPQNNWEQWNSGCSVTFLGRATMRTAATAFSPCSITGFFRIHDRFTDPLRIGSTGAAVTLSKGVTTRVLVSKSRKSRIVAVFNSKPLPPRSVSHYVAREFVQKDGRQLKIKISHDCDLPIGCGYGTSGAGALSLSLALNRAMGLSLSDIESAQIAHVSEVACKTGLGTVASAFTGGLTIRKVAGAPGRGKVHRILLPSSLQLVTASFGPISTRKMLQESRFRSRVNECADRLLSQMDQQRSSANFVSLSKRFASCMDLMSRRLERLIANLDSMGLMSSMAMLGESIFSIVRKDSVSQAREALQRQGLRLTVCDIPRQGARLL
jgi:pantoate kinase